MYYSHLHGKNLLKRTKLLFPSHSNPAAPTLKNGEIAIKNPDFTNSYLPMAIGKVTYKRKALRSRSGYPYRPARLHPHDLDVTKEWYVIFYAYDLTTRQMVRKRVLKEELRELAPDDRVRLARRCIDEINYYLERDAHLETNPAPKVLTFDFRSYSLVDAIQYARNYKLEIEGVRIGTADEYICTQTTVKDFLSHAGMRPGYKLRDINNEFIILYFDYLKKERMISNKTFNNRRAILHSTFEVLIRRDPKLFHGVNPIKKVPTLKTETKKHAAYTDAQMQRIRNSILDARQDHALLFIQFMFYTLARPEEIRNLKVGHIRMADRRILFLSETAKTRYEDYVGINDRFAQILTDSRVLDFPEDHYVFSNDTRLHTPGVKPVGVSYFYKLIKKHIRKIGLYEVNKNYTLYSFKHSGAISLYMATKDIKLLQAQCRHKNIEQTNVYLRDLGLFRDFEQLNQWTGPL